MMRSLAVLALLGVVSAARVNVADTEEAEIITTDDTEIDEEFLDEVEEFGEEESEEEWLFWNSAPKLTAKNTKTGDCVMVKSRTYNGLFCAGKVTAVDAKGAAVSYTCKPKGKKPASLRKKVMWADKGNTGAASMIKKDAQNTCKKR